MASEVAAKFGSLLVVLTPIVFCFFAIGLFGSAINHYLDISNTSFGFWNMIKFAGSGWLVYFIIVSLAFKDPKRKDYLFDLFGVVMFSGILITIPFTIALFLLPGKSLYVALSGIVASLLLMTYRHLIKLKFYNISLLWLYLWIAILLSVSYLVSGNWLF